MQRLREKKPKERVKAEKAEALAAQQGSIPEKEKRLYETLKNFPSFELSLRRDFSDSTNPAQLGGRTFKKVVIDTEERQYVLKKNARERNDEKYKNKKTPSQNMDLEKNHEESFREMCALRLFQYIQKDPRVTTSDAKIILSRFKKDKPGNINRNKETKVYFASEKLPDLDFSESRIGVNNKSILEKCGDDGVFMNQRIIDELCQQTIIQALLSNIDAIKFDNFLVKEESPPYVFQFDFGDARQNEAFSPDPLCIIDEIRRHKDTNSTRSTRSLLERNEIFSFSQGFFKKHISPDHILGVIEKLKNVDLYVLWKIAYCYTYGNHEEKKLYADCLKTKIVMFMSLENLMRETKDDKEFNQEKFSEKTIRGIIIEADKQDKEGLLKENLDKFFQVVNQISEKIIYDDQEDVAEADTDDDVDIVFEGEGEEGSGQERQDSPLSSASEHSDEEDFSDSHEENSDNDGQASPASDGDDSLDFDEPVQRRRLSRQDSVNIDVGEDEDDEDETEITDDDRARIAEIESLLENLDIEYRKIIVDIETITQSLKICAIAPEEAMAQAYDDKSDRYKVKDSDIEDFNKSMKDFYENFKASSLEIRKFSSQRTDNFIYNSKELLINTSNRNITHYKAYETLQKIQLEENKYNKESDFKKISEELGKVGVDVSEPTLKKGKDAKLETIQRMITGKIGAKVVDAARS